MTDTASGPGARRFYAFARKLSRDLAPETLYSLIVGAIAQQTAARIGALAIYREDERALAIAATHGYPRALVEDVRIGPGSGLLGRIYASRRSWLGSIEPLGRPRRLRYESDSCLAVPLIAGGTCLGVVAVTDPLHGAAFAQTDLATARLFAAPAALALARLDTLQRMEETRQAAKADPVTTLHNRRYFEAALLAEAERARRQQQPLSLLIVDIDDFKLVNDSRGHLAGDQVLREVSGILRQSVRIFDTCARYGGEEFAILMPGANQDVAVRVAERICRRIETHYRADPLPLTVSIGAAGLRAEEDTEMLVAKADAALLAAKRSGKNVVRVWPLGTGEPQGSAAAAIR
jgi:diguanylate cyclase (GGDEF)-like protein